MTSRTEKSDISMEPVILKMFDFYVQCLLIKYLLILINRLKQGNVYALSELIPNIRFRPRLSPLFLIYGNFLWIFFKIVSSTSVSTSGKF